MRVELCSVSPQDACAASPLDGGNSIFRDLARILIGKNIGVFADTYVIALELGVIELDNRHLLTRDSILAAEVAVAVAAHDLVFCSPGHRCGVPLFCRNITERMEHIGCLRAF